MKRSSRPKDISIHEASDFWDEHDFDEFNDVREETEIRFLLRKKKYVGIDEELYATIRDKAKALKKSEAVLINEWLSEKAAG